MKPIIIFVFSILSIYSYSQAENISYLMSDFHSASLGIESDIEVIGDEIHYYIEIRVSEFCSGDSNRTVIVSSIIQKDSITIDKLKVDIAVCDSKLERIKRFFDDIVELGIVSFKVTGIGDCGHSGIEIISKNDKAWIYVIRDDCYPNFIYGYYPIAPKMKLVWINLVEITNYKRIKRKVDDSI